MSIGSNAQTGASAANMAYPSPSSMIGINVGQNLNSSTLGQSQLSPSRQVPGQSSNYYGQQPSQATPQQQQQQTYGQYSQSNQYMQQTNQQYSNYNQTGQTVVTGPSQYPGQNSHTSSSTPSMISVSGRMAYGQSNSSFSMDADKTLSPTPNGASNTSMDTPPTPTATTPTKRTKKKSNLSPGEETGEAKPKGKRGPGKKKSQEQAQEQQKSPQSIFAQQQPARPPSQSNPMGQYGQHMMSVSPSPSPLGRTPMPSSYQPVLNPAQSMPSHLVSQNTPHVQSPQINPSYQMPNAPSIYPPVMGQQFSQPQSLLSHSQQSGANLSMVSSLNSSNGLAQTPSQPPPPPQHMSYQSGPQFAMPQNSPGGPAQYKKPDESFTGNANLQHLKQMTQSQMQPVPAQFASVVPIQSPLSNGFPPQSLPIQSPAQVNAFQGQSLAQTAMPGHVSNVESNSNPLNAHFQQTTMFNEAPKVNEASPFEPRQTIVQMTPQTPLNFDSQFPNTTFGSLAMPSLEMPTPEGVEATTKQSPKKITKKQLKQAAMGSEGGDGEPKKKPRAKKSSLNNSLSSSSSMADLSAIAALEAKVDPDDKGDPLPASTHAKIEATIDDLMKQYKMDTKKKKKKKDDDDAGIGGVGDEDNDEEDKDETFQEPGSGNESADEIIKPRGKKGAKSPSKPRRIMKKKTKEEELLAAEGGDTTTAAECTEVAVAKKKRKYSKKKSIAEELSEITLGSLGASDSLLIEDSTTETPEIKKVKKKSVKIESNGEEPALSITPTINRGGARRKSAQHLVKLLKKNKRKKRKMSSGEEDENDESDSDDFEIPIVRGASKKEPAPAEAVVEGAGTSGDATTDADPGQTDEATAKALQMSEKRRSTRAKRTKYNEESYRLKDEDLLMPVGENEEEAVAVVQPLANSNIVMTSHDNLIVDKLLGVRMAKIKTKRKKEKTPKTKTETEPTKSEPITQEILTINQEQVKEEEAQRTQPDQAIDQATKCEPVIKLEEEEEEKATKEEQELKPEPVPESLDQIKEQAKEIPELNDQAKEEPSDEIKMDLDEAKESTPSPKQEGDHIESLPHPIPSETAAEKTAESESRDQNPIEMADKQDIKEAEEIDPLKTPQELMPKKEIEAEEEDSEWEEDGGEVEVEEFFVKYKALSYIHCEWRTRDELFVGDKRIDQKIKRFRQKKAQTTLNYDWCEDAGATNYNQEYEELFNPDYVEVDRILDTYEMEDAEKSRYYLVKWRTLPYEEATWELEQDVKEKCKIERYYKFSTIVPDQHIKYTARPKPDKWVQMGESRHYKNGNKLREYQLEGINWLAFCWLNARNCILADEMGLGKTVQSITFLQEVAYYGVHGPFLILVPLSTIGNWIREFETWTDFNVIVYHGSSASRQMLQDYEFYFKEESSKGKKVVKFHALITTYEVLLSDVPLFCQFRWRSVIIDEAHRLKNKNCKLIEGLKYMDVEHKVLLTGTPLQNNVEELFSLLNFLEPQQFNSSVEFMQEFGDLKTDTQVTKLQAVLKPMMLRRLKEDVEKNLAPKEETIVEVELTNTQKKYYRAILEKNIQFLTRGTSASNMPNLMNTMMELRKCCNHPYLTNGKCFLNYLESFLFLVAISLILIFFNLKEPKIRSSLSSCNRTKRTRPSSATRSCLSRPWCRHRANWCWWTSSCPSSKQADTRCSSSLR